jgi:phosphotransacetylase
MRKAEADHSLSREEIGTYTQSIQQLAIKEENSIEKIKEQLPSSMLVGQYNEIIEKYLKIYLTLDRIQSVDPDDFDAIKKIANILNRISPSDATNIQLTVTLLSEKVIGNK